MFTLTCEGCGVEFQRRRGKTLARVYCTTLCRNKNYGPHKKMPEDFWSRVTLRGPDDCWLWSGATISAGYGSFRWNGRHYTSHRYAYELAVGPVPDGMFVCHHCDVPGCCNPLHLFIGTAGDNNADMMRKGRHVPSMNGPRGSAILSSKLTEAQVALIKHDLSLKRSQPQIAREYGVSTTTINNIAHGKVWRQVDATHHS